MLGWGGNSSLDCYVNPWDPLSYGHDPLHRWYGISVNPSRGSPARYAVAPASSAAGYRQADPPPPVDVSEAPEGQVPPRIPDGVPARAPLVASEEAPEALPAGPSNADQ